MKQHCPASAERLVNASAASRKVYGVGEHRLDLHQAWRNCGPPLSHRSDLLQCLGTDLNKRVGDLDLRDRLFPDSGLTDP